MNGLLLFLLILNAYILLVYFAARSGLLARYNVGLMGPALMFRTQRGKGFIDWLGQARGFFTLTGTWGIWLTLLTMAGITLLLIVQVPFLFQIPEDQAPGAREILALPGINPLIPISYGIVALVAAIVIHEFAHGVLARAQHLKVKSLGLLYLIVPIGAFVEPDEEELKAATRKERMRVYAAGPTSNLVTAVIFGLIFSLGFVAAAEPVADGMGIAFVVPNGPAEQVGMEAGWIITAIDDTRIRGGADFQQYMDNTTPGQEVVVQTARQGAFTLCLGSAADAANISDYGPGFDFCSFQSGSRSGTGDTDDGSDANATLPANDQGFLGISPYFVSPVRFQELMVHPFQDPQAAVLYVALPFTGLTPIKGPLADMYDTPWGDGAGATAYWISANLAYWVMWISLMLGLTNALPAVPLDGGYLFRDFVDGVVSKIRPALSAENRAPMVKRTSVVVSFAILGLILLQFVAPRIAGVF